MNKDLIGLTFTVKEGILAGSRVKVLRQSARTGGLTCAMQEERGCYKVGDEVHLAPYELYIPRQ